MKVENIGWTDVYIRVTMSDGKMFEQYTDDGPVHPIELLEGECKGLAKGARLAILDKYGDAVKLENWDGTEIQDSE